jgi:nucleoside-diphosphate-sugar epimerase
MNIILIGANGKIGELVQKALAGAGHEIVKVRHKSGDFQVEIENRESVRKPYQAVGSFDAVAIAAGQVAFAPLSELTAEEWQFSFTHGSDGGSKAASESVDYGGVRNILAALGSRTARIALMTSIGVTNRNSSYTYLAPHPSAGKVFTSERSGLFS